MKDTTDIKANITVENVVVKSEKNKIIIAAEAEYTDTLIANFSNLNVVISYLLYASLFHLYMQ